MAKPSYPEHNNPPQPALPSIEWGHGNLPAAAAETHTAITQRELFIYWSCLRAQPAPLTQAGLVQKRVLRSINQQLLTPDLSLESAPRESDVPRLHFIRLLLQELGLLIQEHAELRTTGQRNQIPQFWQQSLAERTEACLQAWLSMRNWNELTSLKLSSFDLDLLRARSTLLEQLRLLPPHTWLSADHFLSRLNIVAPRLLFQASDTHSTTSHSAGWRYVNLQNSRLAKIEGAFVGGALSGPLHWLGIVDSSTDEDRLLAFRINASGARALGMEPASEDESMGKARLIVQPNFRIFALGPVPEVTLARLEMFADRVKADRSAFEYALSRETVYRAQQDNLSVADILAFLEQNSSVPLPKNVLRTLQEWLAQHERIVFHRAVSLCQTAKPQLLERLWDDSTLRIHLERRLTPTVAVVRKRRLAALQEALLKRKVLPALSLQDNPCSGRIQATADGELLPVHQGPDMLLDACLRRLAEQRDGKFYVSEAAVTQALASGMSVPEYLDQLGALPDELQSRIKAWGHYYGKAYLREAVFLEVQDSATADELVADAELARMLSRFPADSRGKMLFVHTQDLEALRRRLRKRGIELV